MTYLSQKLVLQVMHGRKILVQSSTSSGDSFWELTWQLMRSISPSLEPDLLNEPISEEGRDAPADLNGSTVAEPGTDAASLPSEDQGTEEHESFEETQ